MGDLEVVSKKDKVEAQYVEMMVPLYSHGCANKIKKALAHFKGIYSINVDYHQQKVTVWGICNKNEVISVIRGKRKGARFWNMEEDYIKGDGGGAHTTPPSSPCNENEMLGRKNKYYAPRMALSIIQGPPLIKWKLAWKKVFNRSHSF